MTFDEPIDRRGTRCSKWDMMEPIYGVSPKDGIAMWVADMDFRAAPCIQQAVAGMLAHGVYGYLGDSTDYHAAIRWWMANRHGWHVEAEQIFSTHGLVNGTALCVDTYTAPGDHVVLATPVYHAFARVIKAAGRGVTECPLTRNGDRLEMDFADWDRRMTGRERMFILCSPHNPGGRVWTLEELRGVADFCMRHDLVLVSDEIHHDLVMPGHKHTAMPLAAPEIADRLVMMTATTKTFNIAGAHVGNVIIQDAGLAAKFAAKLNAMGIGPNAFGVVMATAAYSAEGAAWVDDLMVYLDGNRQLFEAGINAIPGLRAIPLEATYLGWVDFSGTGMSRHELVARIETSARIAVNYGHTFGLGGEAFMRFNFGTQRAVVAEAVERMQRAFADLQ